MSAFSLLIILLYAQLSFQYEIGAPIKIHLGTWNIGGSKPPDSVDALLGVGGQSLPDLVVVGLQEASGVLDKWNRKFDRVLSAKGYFNVRTVEMDFIQITVFALRDHKKIIVPLKNASVDFHRDSWKGLFRQKGTNLLHLKVYGSTVCLLNSHFEADCKASFMKLRACPFGEDTYKKRLEHFNRANEKRKKVCDLNDDVTFWLGDLNFRLSSNNTADIFQSLKVKDFAKLLDLDQLNMARKNGEAFKDFNEPKVTFMPSYKYLVGKDKYKENRIPAWTDRILYSSRQSCPVAESYASLLDYKSSDHRPVIAQYLLKIK